MSVSDRILATGGIVPRRTGAIRPGAEEYAFSLGLAPGGPGWGDAIRDYVLNGARHFAGEAMPERMSPAIAPGDGFRSARNHLDRSDERARYLDPAVSELNHSQGLEAAFEPATDFRREVPGILTPPMPPFTASPAPIGPTRFAAAPSSKPIPPRQQMRRTGASAPPPTRDPSPAGRRAAESLLPPADDGPDIDVRRNSWDKPSRKKRARDLPSGSLAELRETTEVQGRGVGTVSSGRRDPGGASFGSFQLSTNSGNVEAFVKSIHAVSWSADLRGLKPSDPLFKQRWQAIAAREPEAFRRAQQEYLAQARYYPAVDFVWKETGLDLDRRSDAVREAIWSTSGHHGDAETFLPQAVADADFLSRFAGGPVNRSSPAYDEMLIWTIYGRRIKYVQGLRSRDPRKQRTFQNLIPQLERERERALDMLHEEQRRPH
jgi:hypothetical protein